jgi:hypothetical protein
VSPSDSAGCWWHLNSRYIVSRVVKRFGGLLRLALPQHLGAAGCGCRKIGIVISNVTKSRYYGIMNISYS